MSEARRIYLDHAATSCIRTEVLKAMSVAWDIGVANPSALHKEGQLARKLLEEGRATVAKCLNCLPAEIYFTSGGTESDNWALQSFASFAISKDSGKNHIITSQIEHPAVLQTCKLLETKGFRVTYLPVNQYGKVSSDSLVKALTPDTALVSIMYANNEIGTIEPISELASICHERGVLFHTDAVQAVGSIPVSFKEICVDAVSFSSHKFGGPAGIGGLYVKDGFRIPSFMVGGTQEYGFRAGTENLAGVLGLSKALELVKSEMETENLRLSSIRDRLIHEVIENVPGAHLCGHPTDRLPGNAHFVFEHVDGEELLLYLNIEGYACSSGSACTSSSHESSHVLKAIGLSPSLSKSALRITLGRENSEEEVLDIVPVLAKLTDRLRRK